LKTFLQFNLSLEPQLDKRSDGWCKWFLDSYTELQQFICIHYKWCFVFTKTW